LRVSSQSTETGGLAARYAGALFELADETRQVEAVSADMERLAGLLAESADLKRLIRSPVLARADQTRAVTEVAAAAGFADVTRRFLGVLGSNRRLFALPGIVNAFRAILAGRRGEATAEVTAAKPLTEAQRSAIDAALTRATGTKVALIERVDPGLLGGLVVRIGSRMVDSSLRTKLQRLSLAMKGLG